MSINSRGITTNSADQSTPRVLKPGQIVLDLVGGITPTDLANIIRRADNRGDEDTAQVHAELIAQLEAQESVALADLFLSTSL